MAREIDDWLETRRRKDTRGQYQSHLTVLGATLERALAGVRQALDTAPTGSAGALYRACRAVDDDLVFIHRLWRYFADKLEQRDGPAGDLLRGADEVVWSLYAPVVRNAQLADSRVAFRGPPLPHVAPSYAPRVIARTRLPQDLRAPRRARARGRAPAPGNGGNGNGSGNDGGGGRDLLLAEIVDRMPIPVVSLPPWCLTQPWWLIYLAHEVGHHIEHDLLPEAGLVGAVQERLLAVLGGDPLDPATGRWLAWNQEMFADAYAALTAGPAAVWALAEIVWGEDADMRAEQAVYPPPALRLALGHAVCARAGAAPVPVQGRPVPAWLDRWLDGPASADRARMDDVAAALCDLPIGRATLASVCAVAYDAPFAAGGRVAQLAAGLRGPGAPVVTADAEAARLLTCGAVLAYRELYRDMDATADEAARAEAEARLRAAYLDALQQSREPGTRSSEAPSEDDCTRRGQALGDALLADLRARPQEVHQ